MGTNEFSRKRCRRQVSLLALMASLALMPAAYAQDALKRFSIPAQPLATGLTALGEQAGISIAAPSNLVADRQARGLQGDLSVGAALSQMLAPYGLSYEFVGADAVRIVPVRSVSAVPAASSGPLEEIVVTGTRIRGAAPVGSEVVTIGRAEIQETGRSTVKELLATIPQIQTLGSSEALVGGRGQGGSNDTAGAGVNLRGLGTDATLTLVNGRRIAPSGSGVFVDISQIPLTAIERVEVLPDGASALYGSDAIGGVVNFVLRKNQEGAETSFHYGVGDGFQENSASQYLGVKWDGGSASLSYEHYKRSNLEASKRGYCRSDLTALGGTNFTGTGQESYGNPGTIVANGISYAIPVLPAGQRLTAAQLGAPGSRNIVDRQEGVDILPSQRRDSFVGSVVQDLTPDIHLFGDAVYSRRDFNRKNRPFAAAFDVPSTNPFFVSPVAGATSTNVQYLFKELEARSTGKTQNYTVTGGATIDLPRDWKLEAFGTTGKDNARLQTSGLVNTDHFAERIADRDPARAFNPFGSGSSNAASVLSYIEGTTSQHQTFTINSANLNASGGLFDLPGGTVRMAVGAELRHEKYGLDSLLNTNAIPTGRPDDGSSTRTVRAAYAELLVPVVGSGNALPGVRRLDLSFAGRAEDYSDFGSTTNPKLGVSWQPVESFSLRSSWGTSFKAPRLVQLNEGANSYRLAAIPDSTAVAGMPTTYRPGASYVIALIGFGKRDLQPETAHTWSIGGDFHPTSVPGLKAGATFYSIKYKNRILVPNSDEVSTALAQTGSSPLIPNRSPTDADLNRIYNSPAWTVGYPMLPAQNIKAIVAFVPANYGGVQMRGLDLNASYEFATDIGQISLAGSATFVTKYEVTRLPGTAPVDLLNTSSNPNRLRARGSVGWASGAFAAALSENYVGKYKNTTVSPNSNVHGWATTDLHLGYASEAASGLLRGLSVSFDVQNLFDRKPPFVNNGDSMIGYDPEFANPLGRVIGVTLRKTW